MDGFSLFIPLTKADQEKHLVWGRAAVEEFDKAREVMDYVSAKPEFQKWSDGFAKATMGKSLGNIRAMHNPKHLAGKVAEIVYNDDAKAVDICVKVLDPVDWTKVEEGGYTGFSIGGGYVKKWADHATGGTRYTPRIQEISFVDSPCIPSARIMEMQKIDGTTTEVLLKGTPRSFAELAGPASFAELRKVGSWKPMVAGGVGSAAGAAAAGGTGTGSNVGGTLGSIAGEAVGAAFGGTPGALAGGTVGTFAGSKIGSLFDRSPSASSSADETAPGGKKVKVAKQPKSGFRVPRGVAKADGFHPAVELRERFRQDIGAATDAYRPRVRRKVRLHKVIGAPKVKGFRALRTGRRLPGIHFGSQHPKTASAPTTPGTAIMRQAARSKLPSAAHTTAAAPAGMGQRSQPFTMKKRRLMSGLRKAGGYDASSTDASAASAAASPEAAPVSTTTIDRKARGMGATATAAPASSGPSMAAPSYMTKGVGREAARAGIAMTRHLAHTVIPQAAAITAGSAGAKAGYRAARKVGGKLAERMIARGGKLTPRQKKLIVGTATGGTIAGGMAGMAIGHHVAATAAHRVEQHLHDRYGRPVAPGQRKPWMRKAVPGTRTLGKGFFQSGEKPNPPGIGMPGTFKGRRRGLFQKAYEGSPEDTAQDRRGARRLGVSLKAYERTAQDRREDVAGDRRMKKVLPLALGLGGALIGGKIGGRLGARVGVRHLRNFIERGDDLAPGAVGRTIGAYYGGAAGGAIGGAVAGTAAGRAIQRRRSKAQKQALIGRLTKSALLQDDNTVSQWRQARSDQWTSRPFWQMPKDTNDPKQTTMAGMPEQSYGESGGLLSSIFGKSENPYGALAKASPASAAAREKVRLTMHEFKHGTLRSFRADRPKSKMPKVKDRKQAIAIALSQARRIGKGDDGLLVAALADRLAKQRNASHHVANTVAGMGLAGGSSLLGSIREARRSGKTRGAIAQLSPKEHAQRIAAAKARWRKEMPHADMDYHHKALENWANKALLGRDNKLARVKEEAEHFWHHAADAHAAYDKMRPHVGKDASIIMKIPHTPNIVHNPDLIGPEHFTRFGEPKKKIYLMHPDEVDDWIAKHGRKDVSKSAPGGLVEHCDELAAVLGEMEKVARSAVLGTAACWDAKASVSGNAVEAV